MSSIYYKTSDSITPLVEIQPLESNGPGNKSTPRQIVDVEFLDKSFTTPTDAFIVNDDVSARFVQGFTFDVIGGSLYDGTYTVNATGFLPGATVVQFIGGQSHIPVSAITDPALPVVHNFYAGFTSPSVSPTTPGNYLVTWEVDGDVTTLLAANDSIQVKHILYNDSVTNARVNRTYTVVSVTYNILGFTNVVTTLTNETPASTMPVIGVDAQSVVLFPVPTTTTFGYVQYNVPTAATSLQLIGKGSVTFNDTTTWGEALQGNVIHVMENFANTTAPVSPMNGQLWFDTTVGPTAGPSLRVHDNAVWYGVVAEGLPVQGNLNMNGYTIANIQDAVTTFPYVPSATGWGNNDQEVLNLRTADGLYIAKTGGFDANPAARSGTMTGSLNMVGAAGINFKSTGSGSLTFETTTTGGISILGSGGVTVASGNITATAGNVTVGSGLNKAVLQSNVGAPTFTFTTSTAGNDVINLNNNMLTGLSTPVNPSDAVSLSYANGTYVNASGDTMTGLLILSGDPAVALGAATKQYVDNTTVSITGDTMTGLLILSGDPLVALGAATKQYVDNTTVSITGDTMTGPLILNADPTVALGAATKQYVDSLSSGIIWLSPVLDCSLFADDLSTPPTIDAYLPYQKSFIVATGGTGAWTGLDGHVVYYNGTAWIDILNRAVQIGDRFGVWMEPANGDPMTTLPSGGVLGQAGKIATVTGVAPYTYTFYTPAEPDAVTVVGINDPAAGQSAHMGHSYTFRGTWGVGAYGTGYSWLEFIGPQNIIAGTGLSYTGSTLNVSGNLASLVGLASTGMIVQTVAGTVTARTITGTASNIVVTDGDGVAGNPTVDLAPVTQGSAGTSFVKVALDGFGRVTNNTAVTTADITALVDATYMNVAGDTMTGIATFGAAVRETQTAVGASNIDLSLGNYYSKTIAGATTFTVSNVPTSGTTASFILDLINGGSAVVTWWANVKWAGGTAPTLTAAGRDVLGFFTYDNGTTWTGLVLGKDVK